MTRTGKILLASLALFTLLYVANGIFYGSLLSNCARTYDEGMNAQTLRFDVFINPDSSYLPGYEAAANLAERLVGRNWTGIYLTVNTFHLLLLLVFLCLLGAKMKDLETGFLASFLFLLYPLAAGTYNRYCMDFSMAGALVMAVYFLAESRFFTDIKYSLLFFASCAYGISLKDSFPGFIAGPAACAAIYGLKNLRKTGSGEKKVFFALLAAISLAAWRFFLDFRKMFWDRLFWEPSGNPWYSPENLEFFWKGVWETQLSPFFALLLLPGIYYFLKEEKKETKLLLGLWIALPNLILLAIPHGKAARYLLPQLPALALITALALRKTLDSPRGRTLLSLTFAAGAFQLYAFMYDPAVFSGASGKNFNWWKPEKYMLGERLDAQSKIMNTDLAEKISKKIIADIKASPGSRAEKKCVIAFFPSDWSLEAYIARSYFLMNGGPEMEEALKGLMLYSALNPKDPEMSYRKFFSVKEVNYAVQIEPRGHPAPPLAERLPAYLRSSYELTCVSLGSRPVPQDWGKLSAPWASHLSKFVGIGAAKGVYFDARISADKEKAFKK
ncbi:MAG: hypothetical protein COT17_04145 [Elusimicrobia bacterium CG08_land_8_20_14_0_20_51_18]|nr:MAG: hypothetical protein COT17_04145 [Elusimicrobia bacterium CG08_land_8_20_14_0_20_51_18]